MPVLKSALQALLLKGVASSQEELCELLTKEGYQVNQSKISRLLRKLGASKIVNETGVTVYVLPKEPAPPATKSTVNHLVVNVLHNENLIVVRTSPGAGSLIARVLDYHQQELAIIGTIAGDDTILVVPASVKNVGKVLTQVKALLQMV